MTLINFIIEFGPGLLVIIGAFGAVSSFLGGSKMWISIFLGIFSTGLTLAIISNAISRL